MLYKLKSNKYGSYQLVIYKDNTNIKQDDDLIYDTEYFDEYGEIAKVKNAERDYNDESSKRAKRTILEYAQNNEFKWFMTFTFDINKIDRYDYDLVKKKLLKAIQNYKMRFKDFSYIITPELHTLKEGEIKPAIHFHALFSEIYDLKYVGVDSKTGHKLFKSDYFFERFGRCQAIRIFDYTKFVAYYISKYITKDEYRIFKRRYFVSQGLNKSIELLNGSYDFDKLNSLKTVLPTFENSMCISYDIDDISILSNLINELKKEI